MTHPKFELKIPSFGSLDMTGSVSGRSSIEMPTRSRTASVSPEIPAESREQNTYDDRVATIPRQSIVFRPVDDGDDSAASETTRRIEQQLAQVRRRLDQLARQQESFHHDGLQQRSVLMEREAEFLDALKKLGERPNPQTVVVEVHPSEAPVAKASPLPVQQPPKDVFNNLQSNGEPALPPEDPEPLPKPTVAQASPKQDVPPAPRETQLPSGQSSNGEPRLDDVIAESAPAVLPESPAPIGNRGRTK